MARSRGVEERTTDDTGAPAQRTPLDRDVVAEAAIRLLDEVGLDGLTLRRLAQRLGVRAPALYWHFTGKRDLLDHMAQMIVARSAAAATPGLDRDWDEWLGEHARIRRRTLLAHRDGVRLAAGSPPADPALPLIEQMVGVLVGVGFAPDDALRNVVALGNYVDGFVLEEQAHRRRYAEYGRTSGGAAGQDALPDAVMVLPGQPALSSALRGIGEPGGDEAFEHGLALLLDGMRAALARRRRRRRAAPSTRSATGSSAPAPATGRERTQYERVPHEQTSPAVS